MSIKEIRNSIDFEKPEKVIRKPPVREEPSADIVSSCSVKGNESSEESFAGAKRVRPQEKIKLEFKQNKVGSAIPGER